MLTRARLGGALLGLGLALAGAGPAAAQTDRPPAESLSRADLSGRALDVRLRCETDTTVKLQSRFAAARQAAIACRDGRGRAKLRLTAREAARAGGSSGLALELAIGGAAPKVLDVQRPATKGSRRPIARKSSGGYWDLAYASCVGMSGIRNLDIHTNGTLFGDRPAPVGYNWGYNPGSTVWVSPGAYTYRAGVYSWYFAPWRQTVVGTRDGWSIGINPDSWVKPALEVYGGNWNWVRTVYAFGLASFGGNDWCYFS